MLPARCHDFHGRVIPDETVWIGTGVHSAHFYWTGLEYGLQCVLLTKECPARNVGGSAIVPLELVAEIHSTGAAAHGHRPDLEFNDVGGWRLVFSDGMRN